VPKLTPTPLDRYFAEFAEFKRRLRALELRRSVLTWVDVPSFSNGWENIGAPFQVVSYSKDAQGIVWIRGVASAGGVGTMFTLPSGFRPAATELFGCDANGTSGGHAIARIDISDDGTVTYQSGPTSSNYCSLSGIAFEAA
jgi:hypothetical protein